MNEFIWGTRAVFAWLVAFVRSFFGATETTLEIIGSEDSGHGSSVRLDDGETNLVLDCGTDSTNGSMAGQRGTDEVATQIVAANPDYIIVTHYHSDHYAALPAVEKAYRNARRPVPPIIATDPTWELLQGRLYDTPLSPFIAKTMGFRGESAKVRLIPNRHSVIGSAGVLVLGRKKVLYTSDFWAITLPEDLPPIDLLIINCTCAYKTAPREDVELRIRKNVLGLIKETLDGNSHANAYVAMFSTQLDRAMWFEHEVQSMTGITPVIMGASLRNNLDAVRPGMHSHGFGRVALVTGVWAHGERRWLDEGISALVRLSNGNDRYRSLKRGDLVVLSGSIPTWSPELTAQIKKMCERLAGLGVRLVVDVSAPEDWSSFAERKEVHAGGHASGPEVFDLIDQVARRSKPGKLQVMPFHASLETRKIVADYCTSKGIKVVMVAQSQRITI